MIRLSLLSLILSCSSPQEMQSITLASTTEDGGDGGGTCVTWSSLYPDPAGDVVISSGHVVLDIHATADSVTVLNGATLEFDPAASRTLTVAGNVEVRGGTLRMAPDNALVDHVLSFPSIDEALLPTGGGMSVTDHPGLWITEGGVWDAHGTPKAAWVRGSIDASWDAGDEIAIAPSGSAAEGSGLSNWSSEITTAGVGTYPGDDLGHPIEVANLARNVRVEGAPGGRTHIIFLGPYCARQDISYVSVRYASPTGVLGRYGMHWHHCGDTSRGTVVRGAVVRDAGDHAYVTHGSHGITVEDSIAIGIDSGAAVWWDSDTIRTYPKNATHDSTWRRVLVLDFHKRAFWLGQGVGNRIIDSAAAGTNETGQTGGLHWPSQANQMPNVWTIDGFTAHNIRSSCMNVWQNDRNDHNIHDIDLWRCGQVGWMAGAYGNSYRFDRISAQIDGDIGLNLKVVGVDPIHGRSAEFRLLRFDGAGIKVQPHSADGSVAEVLLADISVNGLDATDPAILYSEGSANMPSRYAYLRVLRDGADISPADVDMTGAHPLSVARIEQRDGTAWEWHASSAWLPIGRFSVSEDYAP